VDRLNHHPISGLTIVYGGAAGSEESPHPHRDDQRLIIPSFALSKLSTPICSQQLYYFTSARWGKKSTQSRIISQGYPARVVGQLHPQWPNTRTMREDQLTGLSFVDAKNKVPEYQRMYQAAYKGHTRIWNIVSKIADLAVLPTQILIGGSQTRRTPEASGT
jgi:Cytochrome c oxidase subunit VII